MNTSQKERGVVAGMWKFKDSVGEDVLLSVAGEWRSAEPDRYGTLFIRRCSKDQLAIGFSYRFQGGSHRPFYNRITDQLKRRFGNDFVGWDITPDIWMLPDTDADWTVDLKTNRVNSSPEFVRLTSEIAKLIRNDIQILSEEQAERTASLILAQLAHVHGLAPRKNRPVRISVGTSVRTTQANMSLRIEWTDQAWASRQWGVRGHVLRHHDSHGLSYEVQHADGTVGHYDPSELEVIE